MPDETVPGTLSSEAEKTPDPAEPPAAEEELVLEDLLVEDVSIDGMCGVY
jgi:mycofactocin precursor